MPKMILISQAYPGKLFGFISIAIYPILGE